MVKNTRLSSHLRNQRRRRAPLRRKAIPARFRYSKKTYRANQSISRTLKSFSESKLSAVVALTEGAPAAIQAGALAYKHTSVLGLSTPSHFTGIQHSLGGVSFPPGTGANNRIGNYLYLRKTYLVASIEMNQANPASTGIVPVVFRMIVFKQKRQNQPTGTTVDPATTLFLDESGNNFGASTTGKNGHDLMLQPLNRRSWTILKDTKFTLQPPLLQIDSNVLQPASHYPMRKDVRININHQAKAYFTGDEPQDYDYRYGVFIYAHAIGRDYLSNPWEVSYRGTTSAYDN